MTKKLDGQFVVPGERLGVVEEFDPGPGTVDVQGTVYAAQTGKATLDATRRKVTVKTLAGPPVVPEEGSTVIGVVEKVQEKMAIVSLIMVDNHKVPRPFTGMLHISTSIAITQHFGGTPAHTIIFRDRIPDPSCDRPHRHEQPTVWQQYNARLFR